MEHDRTSQIPLATLPDCVFRADLSLRLQEVSAAASTLLGIPADALTGTSLADLVTPDDLIRLEDLIRQTLTRADRTTSLIYQTRLRHADGHLIPVEVHSRVVLGEDGEPVGVVGIARDLTTRLGEQAAARQRERERLQDQKDAALAHLAANVSEDLAAILADVAGGERTGDQGELAPRRRRAEERLRQLQLIAGQVTCQREDQDVDSAVAAILAELGRELPPDQQPIHQPGCGGAEAPLDRQLLRQALAELLANARQAAPASHPITVRTAIDPATPPASATPAAPAAPWIRISVHDTGPGLTAAARDRAGEPFFTTRPEADGLGLSLVRGVAVAHGGRLHLESPDAGGTVATLSLPARHAGAERAESPPPAPSRGTVLVVDDDPEILRYVARVLRAERLHVIPCADGVDALAHLAAGDPVDLVLLDWALPGLDGRRVREQVLRRQPRVPLLVISGHAREEYTALGGVDADTPWLVKPFTPGELRAAVAARLARREAASGS